MLHKWHILSAELFMLCKFQIQKCGQTLCAHVHKPYFFMPGHINRLVVDSETLTCLIFVMHLQLTSALVF